MKLNVWSTPENIHYLSGKMEKRNLCWNAGHVRWPRAFPILSFQFTIDWMQWCGSEVFMHRMLQPDVNQLKQLSLSFDDRQRWGYYLCLLLSFDIPFYVCMFVRCVKITIWTWFSLISDYAIDLVEFITKKHLEIYNEHGFVDIHINHNNITLKIYLYCLFYYIRKCN